jgi:hypothetical protein
VVKFGKISYLGGTSFAHEKVGGGGVGTLIGGVCEDLQRLTGLFAFTGVAPFGPADADLVRCRGGFDISPPFAAGAAADAVCGTTCVPARFLFFTVVAAIMAATSPTLGRPPSVEGATVTGTSTMADGARERDASSGRDGLRLVHDGEIRLRAHQRQSGSEDRAGGGAEAEEVGAEMSVALKRVGNRGCGAE